MVDVINYRRDHVLGARHAQLLKDGDGAVKAAAGRSPYMKAALLAAPVNEGVRHRPERHIVGDR